MFTKLFVVLLLGVVLVFDESHGHSYSLGNCPMVDPMPGFSMNGMLGVWYAIQKTSTASTCITYNFTRLEEPDEYKLEQISQHFVLGLTPLQHEYHYTGQITVPDASVPAKMNIKFPLNVLGSASYTIFMTDYENYAAIFTCQKLGFAHRQSATILSRMRTLDKVYIDKIRTRLASYNIDPFDLSIISQKDCPKNKNGTNGVNINIDDNTFTAESVAGVVRTAGEKLGDGIEFVAGNAKRAYNSLSGTVDNLSQNGQQSGGKIRGEAEYISGDVRRTYDNVPRSLDAYTQQNGRSEKEKYVTVDPYASEWLP